MKFNERRPHHRDTDTRQKNVVFFSFLKAK